MRYETTATCLSWIPPTAVEGSLGVPFALRIAHYDQPPPDDQPDVDALIAGDAIRFANQLHAWIEVTDGRITAYGSSGGGRLGSTTFRLTSRSLTFPGVALPDLRTPPEHDDDSVTFTQTAGGHTGRAHPGSPVFEVGPGSIYSPTLAEAYREQQVTVRARTPARFAVLPLARLGDEALAALAADQAARLARNVDGSPDS